MCHSWSCFLPGLLIHHDRARFEVHCYSSTPHPDKRTEDFRRLAEVFVDISALSDDQAAEVILSNQVDILVDLGGRTQGSRLGIFARRPAPIQATYLGYPATTGCPYMDYRLVDELTDPPGSESHAIESLVRLPSPFLNFYPHFEAPSVTKLPALKQGFLTFGSFNQAAKISDRAIQLWSSVLQAVPGSRLFLKASGFQDPGVCRRIEARFSDHGISASRLRLSGFLPKPSDHLAAYSEVDIALDTFPYHGTTTTCEALWMGVPVVSLTGGLHAARVGLSLMTSVGLGELAAATPEEFLEIALELSRDLARLEGLRGCLRDVVRESPLCDGRHFTAHLEAAYRTMLTSLPS